MAAKIAIVSTRRERPPGGFGAKPDSRDSIMGGHLRNLNCASASGRNRISSFEAGRRESCRSVLDLLESLQ